MIYVLCLSFAIAACTKEVPMKEDVIQHTWKESALFKSGNYTMIGEEGDLGFLYDDSDVTSFYPNKESKYMWHFWGKEDQLHGDIQVLGTHENSNEPIIIVPIQKQNALFLSPNNGADHHVPSMMMLPKSGMWKLDAYIGNKVFGSVYVKVHEK